MSSTTHDRTTSFGRIAAIIGLILLSVALPVTVVYLSVISAVSGKPWGEMSSEEKWYFPGCVKDGELWFPVRKSSGELFPKSFREEIRRLNLSTGVESGTEISAVDELLIPICWINGELYIIGGKGNALARTIYKTEGTSLQKVGTWTQNSRVLWAGPFSYDGLLTRVQETDDGELLLQHLIDGAWVEGRKVVLPGFGRFRRSNNEQSLTVIQNGQQTHLLLQDQIGIRNQRGIFLYRNGFSFAEDSQDGVSALAPDNSAPEITAWEPIPSAGKSHGFIQMACDGQGVFLYSSRREGRHIWRNTDGKWEAPIVISDLTAPAWSKLLPGTFESNFDILDMDNRTGAAAIHHLNGNTIQPAHLTITGSQREYLARWRLLIGGLLSAWLLHLSVLIFGADGLQRRVPQNTYQFGGDRVTVASIGRRALAMIVDLLLISLALFLLMFVQSWGLGVQWKSFTERDLCEWLFGIEQNLPRYLPQSVFEWVNRVLYGTFSYPLGDYLALIVFGIVDAAILFGLRVYTQSRFGFTPGKWLFGIRIVRSTLRPCGFARALVRDLLYWIDIPLLISPLPAVTSMLLSQHHQRLGDRVADTLVVHTEAIRENR